MFTSIIYLVYSTIHIAIDIRSAWASSLYDSLPSPEYTGKRASRPKRSYRRGTSGRNLRNVNASTTLPRISPMLVCLPFHFHLLTWSSNCKLKFSCTIPNMHILACRRERPAEKPSLRRLVGKNAAQYLFMLWLRDDLFLSCSNSQVQREMLRIR